MESSQILQRCPLFAGIAEDGLGNMLGCLAAQRRSYGKNEIVFAAGQPLQALGIVLSGSVHVIQEDYWGNRSILAHVGPGALFGETFSCAGTQSLPVSVLAADKAEVLLVDSRKIITTCPSACVFHTQLIQNMLQILAQKNMALTQKIETVTQRSTRGKVLTYLSAQAQQAGSNRFSIPFNRQELADFLAVDRSAMSSELSKMQKEGLLRYKKNEFELILQ